MMWSEGVMDPPPPIEPFIGVKIMKHHECKMLLTGSSILKGTRKMLPKKIASLEYGNPSCYLFINVFKKIT